MTTKNTRAPVAARPRLMTLLHTSIKRDNTATGICARCGQGKAGDTLYSIVSYIDYLAIDQGRPPKEQEALINAYWVKYAREQLRGQFTPTALGCWCIQCVLRFPAGEGETLGQALAPEPLMIGPEAELFLFWRFNPKARGRVEEILWIGERETDLAMLIQKMQDD